MSATDTTSQVHPRPTPVRAINKRNALRLGDPVFRVLATAAALTIAVAMFGLAIILVYRSWPSISALGTDVLTTVSWSPVNGQFGVLAALAGTVLSTLIAMVIAVPLALVIALLLVELAPPRISRVIGTGIEMLAAIPSIVYGMVGIFVIVPFMQESLVPWILATPIGSVPGFKPGPKFQGGGLSIFTAGVVLAFMVLPFVTAVSRDVLAMVPRVIKEAGYGMGSTTWEVTRKISMPYANSGIVGGIFIGFGRALGETMAVAYLIGSLYTDLPRSIFDPGTSIASLIAQQFSEATDEVQISALIQLGLILFVITMGFQVLAQLWLRRVKRSTGGRA